MSTRHYSLRIYMFAMSLLSLLFFTPAYSMEKGTNNKFSLSSPSAQIGKPSSLVLDAESLQQAQTAAFDGLKTMVLQLTKTDVLDEKHAKDLGLEPNDFLALTGSIGNHQILSDPIRIFHVRLSDLRDFGPSEADRNLMIDTNQLLFPVRIGDDDKFSVTVQSAFHAKNTSEHQAQMRNWVPIKWGLPNLTRRLATQQKCVRDKSPNSKDFSLVSIPSLNRNFLGYQDSGEIKLIPVTPGQDCETGEPLSAQEVLLGLVKEANRVDGSPR